jgi:hypothetical protein
MNTLLYLLGGTIALIALYITLIRPWTLTWGATKEETTRLLFLVRSWRHHHDAQVYVGHQSKSGKREMKSC